MSINHTNVTSNWQTTQIGFGCDGYFSTNGRTVELYSLLDENLKLVAKPHE